MLKKNFAIPVVGFFLASAGYGADPGRVPVLLELFTSEGCSSCPPADQLLERLDRDQPIPGAELIVLSEHVDYWNRLGWTDPYSSSQFSRRQEAYAAQFRTDDIYTPQLVVDGSKQAVGGNWPMAARAIQESLRERKMPVTVRATRSAEMAQLSISSYRQVQNEGAKRWSIWPGRKSAKSHVTQGENSGRELTHVAAVSSLRKIARISSKEGVLKDVSVKLNREQYTNHLIRGRRADAACAGRCTCVLFRLGRASRTGTSGADQEVRRTHLFVAQSDHGIDARRSPSRNVASRGDHQR